jgi:hypothetical protein
MRHGQHSRQAGYRNRYPAINRVYQNGPFEISHNPRGCGQAPLEASCNTLKVKSAGQASSATDQKNRSNNQED